ncbi:N-acetylglucosamine-6-phosphate deacetylase [Spiroplasma ixodetis]|uniref:N-acetylglucosamine-6-phosphate deacetylase n=1 Tax=Spiroplasma ixodetis TaxID=2141 RepID=UPI002577E89E|nr:N-acetylglucosamine-6-phosphate deacetylase [Spiroplasma ixodetis]WJG70084.1 N-acetylglucosamine-6-phosphate deacetylase [Spiroplasma ixodetis Y32]
MSKILVLNNAKIISIKKIINNGFLVIKDNLIFQINEGTYNYEFQDAQVIDCHNQTIIPGFIDLHVHGGYGYSLMDGTIESINNFAKLVPKEGVTKFCYATVTDSKKEIDNILSVFAKYMKTENKGNKARIIGAYLEGPFISELQKGAHTPSLLHVPDLNLVKSWNIISNKNLKFIVYAPEIDPNLNNKNSNFISSLIKNNIIPSVGHSNATFKEITKTVEYGLTHITHLYNAMSPYNHRDPGVVPASLYYDQLVTELICDGIHVDIDILAITYKIKGADGICMITDAMSAKGQPDGKYLLGPLPVIKSNNKVTVEATGKLAGSIATMIAGFKNLLKITNNNWQDCIKMASYNSAKQVGIANKTGDIVIGKLADIIVLTKNNDIFLTICEGKIAYQQE